ncbi:MAG: hypothetical protein LBC85_11425 [Fibromonadaceae bacterium]|nr:hypothetical protein [Fibromonadaceae bacterium]
MHAYEAELVKKYAFAVGVDFAITKGDFDGKTIIHSSEKAPEKESVILPKVPFFLVYAFDARALANASVMAFNFGLGFPSYEHNLQSGDARYFRLGLEYQYHFFWPEDFRVGAGLGYTFSSMRFPKASFAEEDSKNYANFTGNGPHAVFSANYYFSKKFAAECAFRYRLLHLNRVATDLNDVSKITPAIFQNMGEFGARFMFVF